MGDKAEARRIAASAGVPTIPGTDGTAAVEEATAVAGEIGYPVLVKAAAGGGGRGIRLARDEDELVRIVGEAALEAGAAFGDDSLYVEKQLVGARHVEVQVLGDSHGRLVHLYERECSLQRRRQKLIEECPAPGLGARLRAEMADAALRLARASGYSNAGTVEFLVDSGGDFYFIEMNTRIQVEHPVTEAVTRIDLVKEQLLVAGGNPLSFGQEDVTPEGAAIEVRVNAEDPARSFLPSPGEITALELPGGPGVRVDTAAYAGYHIPPFYDSLVAKLVCSGRDRAEALARTRRALREFRIDGIHTTIPFHLDLLADESVQAGDYDVGFVERRLAGSARTGV
jgi:acetyl-CoA carboxylase biotin carboxylase subunit